MSNLSQDDPAAALDDLVRIMVTGFRAGAKAMAATHPGLVDDAKIARFVKEAFEEALREDGRFIDDTDVGDCSEVTPTMAGAFRMVLVKFGIDPADQFEQETWFSVVEKALAESLARSA